MTHKFDCMSIKRLSMGLDGNGVVSLVAGYGCPLACKYCLNPRCLNPDTKRNHYTAEQLIDILRIDNLYFLATGGGITFGGGEPLLQAPFIKEFCGLRPKGWNVNVETSFNVDLESVKMLADEIALWIIDIKDMDPNIYQSYTGKDNSQVLTNLKWLSENVDLDKVIIRIPLIPDFNSLENQEASQRKLEELGFHQFDVFHYIIREH